MKMIHALWIPKKDSSGLHFWAENADLIQTDKSSDVSFHPYSLPQLEILGIFQNVLEFQAPIGLETINLVLPSISMGPLPSTDLFYADAEKFSKEDFMMKSWTLRSVVFSPELIWKYLIPISQLSVPQIGLSTSVTYWLVVLEFALELLSRKCFLPEASLTPGKSTELIARWSPYFSHDDHRRMITLAEAMPPSSLSFASADEQALNSQKVLLHALRELMDCFIRTQLNEGIPYIYRINASKKVSHVHEQWLKALFSQKSEVKSPAKKAEEFVAKMSMWIDPLKIDYEAPFRISFCLSPPSSEDPEENWVLSYYLQLNRDLSVIISGSDIWKRQKEIEEDFKGTGYTIQKLLQDNLIKAARYFEPLSEFLKNLDNPYIQLETSQAYFFLRTVVPLLEDCGFGMRLPSWWKNPLKRLGVRLQVIQVGTEAKVQKYMGLDTIVEYDWRLALGDEVLEFSEFQRLVELKKPLVKVRGEWIELKTDEIEKAIAFFQKRAEKKKMTLADIMALTLEDESSSLGLPVVGVDNFSNNEALFSLLNQSESLKELPVPVAFKGELRPYQRKGLSWLWFLHRLGLGGCLADDMGLGKTIQMIALFLHERSLLVPGERLPPTLIMCPMSIISNWKNELKRFAPEINVLLHHGINRMGKEEFAKEISLYDVVITTYALVAPDLEKLNSVCWNRIVLDEAQNIKNNHTKQTQAIKKLNGGHRVALTGTPLENRLLELWSIMDFLNPYYLGGAKEFSQKYAVPIERFGDVDKSEQLKRVIRPFILRRVKTDKNVIKDLPEKIETKEHCYLTKEQVSLYESVVKRMLETIDKYEGIKRRGIILSVLIQLKQICNHPVQYLKDESSLTGRSGKMTRLHELLDEVMAEGDKALIFTQFSQMGHLLKKDLQERLKQEVLFLHGMSTKTQRDEMIERFQSKDSAPHLFILSLKAGGLGLNLTSANHVFHFDRWWNPAIENQATDRAFRIGQKKTVHVHKFMCQGTVEEKIDEMIKRKTHLTDLVVEQGENWITELSTEDLKNLFHLKLEDI